MGFDFFCFSKIGVALILNSGVMVTRIQLTSATFAGGEISSG
jgi:hypothetical protein